MLNEPDPSVCPKCGKADLKRIMSTFRVAGLYKKSAGLNEAMPDMAGGMPGGMDMGMDDMAGGDAGMGGDEGGEMPMDGGIPDMEEPS